MNVIADEGETVTCENGHPLYRITRPVQRGELFRAAQFEAICERLEQPVAHQCIPLCPECSAPWIRTCPSRFGFQVHFENGWRP